MNDSPGDLDIELLLDFRWHQVKIRQEAHKVTTPKEGIDCALSHFSFFTLQLLAG